MGTYPIVRPIRYRVRSWRVRGTGSGELLSIITTMTVRMRVGIVVVGWIEARCPSWRGLYPYVGVVIYPTNKRCALHLRNSAINLERSMTKGDTRGVEPCWPSCPL